jgi:hypothetical protein
MPSPSAKGKRDAWSKGQGDGLDNLDRPLLDIIGEAYAGPGFPMDAKYGNLLVTVGWILPAYDALTRKQLEAVIAALEKRTNRPYDWSRTMPGGMAYPGGACACCSCPW